MHIQYTIKVIKSGLFTGMHTIVKRQHCSIVYRRDVGEAQLYTKTGATACIGLQVSILKDGDIVDHVPSNLHVAPS